MKVVIYFDLFVPLCSGEGGTLQTNITGMCGECSQCMDHTGFAPAHGMCAFLVYTAQAPGCSAGELSKAGPVFHALPRSKLLRFRFSGTPQRHRLGLSMCLVFFPGPSSSGDQVFGKLTLPTGRCVLSPPRSQLLGFLSAPGERCLRCALCLLWGADL